MRHLLLLPLAMLLAYGCERSGTETPDAATADEAPEVIEEEITTYSGAEAYKLACAQCHDQGLQGAPRIDDADTWEGRSWLWEAVLFEHAKSGYNNMPAKGGYNTMPDDVVEKAAEYMLSQTSNVPTSE